MSTEKMRSTGRFCSNRVPAPATRREFLQRTGMQIGSLALGALLSGETQALGADPVPSAKRPHFPSKAKHVIHIFAGGGPSHLDTFDWKPQLQKQAGKTVAGLGGVIWPTPFRFQESGRSGLAISELFPHLQREADELCIVRSLHSEVPAHDPGAQYMHTGSAVLTRPSLGSWLLYGLGSANENLPGFVCLGGKVAWRQAAFLPSGCQGTRTNFKSGIPVDRVIPNLRSEFSKVEDQRRQLDYMRKLNEQHMQSVQRDEQLEARIESFELAFRMQAAATEAFDVSKEPASVREAYGKTRLADQLLCARRLVERGVRFVQVDASGWDHHSSLVEGIRRNATDIDQPAAALIADLRSRGLLEQTLILWGGEFGRPPTVQGRIDEKSGRDHWSKVYCCWLAGGGVRPGIAFGESDDIGAEPSRDPVHLHDLHATLLHLMGFDHTRLIHRYNGRDFRLTDNFGKVMHGMIG